MSWPGFDLLSSLAFRCLAEGEGYRQRTKRNVAASDATLIFTIGELCGGSLATLRLAECARKPVRVVALDKA